MTADGRDGEQGAAENAVAAASPDRGDGHAADSGAAHRAFARGIELKRRDALEAAGHAFAEALEADATFRPALTELGGLLRLRGLRTAAAAALRRALDLTPDDIETLSILGLTLRELGEPEAALTQLHRAVSLDPDLPEAHHNLGLALADLGHFAEAELCFQRALKLRPDLTIAAWERSLARLAAGDYRQGFAGLEARWGLRRQPRPHADLPPWDGTPLEGRSVLVFNEQALGDGILFARFLPRLKAAGAGAITLECHRTLARLFRTLPAVDRVVVAGEERPPADVAVSLLSLPGFLGLGEEDLPAEPYLAVPPVERPAPARPALVRPAGCRLAIGLCWAGRPSHRNDRQRSAGLKPFLPLLRHAGIAFYSLQKGPAAAAVAEQGVAGLIHDLSPQIDDLADAAHWAAQLDLVISVDTAIAHLAGALGVPCWVVLPWLVDWRWGRERDETAWYGRMHLFRQPRPGDWDSVFSLVDQALDQVLAG